MMNYDTKQFREMYNNLPEDLKDAIFSADVSDKIIEIGTKYKLAVDKIGIVGSETGRVMLGVTHPNEFIANLVDRLEVDKETARNIANDINEQIFKKVRESLRKIHNIRSEEDEDKNRQVAQVQSPFTETIKPLEKADILKEIEREHSQENKENKEELPAIMQGATNPFDAKMGGGVYVAPVEEKKAEPILPEKPKNKYPEFDPYREPIE